MYKTVRFNEKELSYFAINLVPDKEGLLEKKGAVRGQGFKQRWFRLKGNLLFYFKVDELQDWESTGDPVGVIVLERYKVENTHSDSQPFSFALNFEGDISRSYVLRAYSQLEQRMWMSAIGNASYEKLKFKLYKLQEQLYSRQGGDPFLQRQGVAHKTTKSSSPLLSSNSSNMPYRRSLSQKARTIVLKSTAHPDTTDFLIQFSCSNIPHYAKDKSINSVIHILYSSPSSHSQVFELLDSTEIVESVTSPLIWWHQMLLSIGLGHCSSDGTLLFKLMSINKGQLEGLSVHEKKEECSLDFVEREREIGHVFYSVKKLMDLAHNKTKNFIEIQLNEGKDNDAVKLNITVNQVRYQSDFSLLSSSPVSPVSPRVANITFKETSILPEISKSSTWSHYNVPVKDHNLMVAEEFAECVFNTLVPVEMLRFLRKNANVHLEELNYNIGALSDSYQEPLKQYRSFLFESVGLYTTTIKELENLTDGFKPVTSSQDPNLVFLPTNLHVQKFHVLYPTVSQSNQSTYGFVTMGSPTYRSKKWPTQGLKSVISSLPCCPSFVLQSVSSSAGLVVNELGKLTDIRRNFEVYKNALFRSSGNANPREMSSAFTGISTEVQKLLALTQSSIVLEAIGDLIRARPGNPPLSLSTSPSISTSAAISINPDRNLSLRKTTTGPKRVGCKCGKCAKCLPSPSDWIWNGSHYVQVSTGEWKIEDTAGSIQELLVRLLDKVEEGSKKVVELQHEAHAASTDTVALKMIAFKPTYVWSASLIPAVMELHQTIEGFIKLAYSSLSFSLMRLDSCIPNLFELKKYMDIVFCQTLTGLVTSFYITLSKNFTDHFFMEQLKEIGYLAHFECLSNSTGEEINLLEDMYIGLMQMKNVKFQLAAISGVDVDFDFHIIGTRENPIVQFLINRNLLSRLPNEYIKLGHCIEVVPVLFAYGTNDTAKSLLYLQDEINSQSIATLSNYVASYKSLTENFKNEPIQTVTVKVREQLHQLKVKFEKHKSKNVEVFISAEQLCRTLNGGRVTTCRAGKDRTSMAVTLEECVLLRNEHKMSDTNFVKVLSTLRSTGTQLTNCMKNTGHRCYNFNSAQYQMLPKIYQPPLHTCRSRHSFVD